MYTNDTNAQYGNQLKRKKNRMYNEKLQFADNKDNRKKKQKRQIENSIYKITRRRYRKNSYKDLKVKNRRALNTVI